MTTKPATKKAAKTDWAADLGKLDAMAAATSFPATASTFSHILTPASPGQPKRVLVSASVPAATSKPTVVRVPEGLKARIQAECAGSWTVAVAVLADAMLEHLAQTGQQMASQNKE